MNLVDLHIHSTLSHDGDMTPSEIVREASEKGMAAIAITDHDNVRGVFEALEAGRQHSLEVVPGVEIECEFLGYHPHITGYFIDHEHEGFSALYRDILEKDQAASRERIRLVKSVGFDLDEDEVMAVCRDGAVYAPSIAGVLLSKPDAADNPLMRPYLPGGERSMNAPSNFYWDYCAPGRACYVDIERIGLRECVELILRAGGVPCMAHPYLVLHEDHHVLEDVRAAGVMGLEAYCYAQDEAQCAFYSKEAERLGFLKTLGSDFHGRVKPAITLGDCHCGEDELKLLDALKAAHAGLRLAGVR